MSSVDKSAGGRNSVDSTNDVKGIIGGVGFIAGENLDSQNNLTSLSTMQQSDTSNNMDETEQLMNTENKLHLPSIPVAMRRPHVVSSVKQYRTEEQHHQLEQPFISEAFISMMPHVTKPPRKRRRPPFSYSSLIAQAILEAENERLTLREIYQWIVKKYPSLYGANDIGWQNTIRHNLSLNKCFKKIPKQEAETSTKGKGGYWTIDPDHMIKFKNGAFARGSSSTLRRKPSYNTNTSHTVDGTGLDQERPPIYSSTASRNSVNLTQEQHLSPSNSSAPSSRSPSPSLFNPLQPIEPTLQSIPSKQLPPHTIDNMTSSFRVSNVDTHSNSNSTSSSSSSCTVMNIHNLLN